MGIERLSQQHNGEETIVLIIQDFVGSLCMVFAFYPPSVTSHPLKLLSETHRDY